MLSFKEYITIQEALNIAQKKYLDIYDNPEPSEHTRELSKNLFPEGQDTVRLPITNDTQGRITDHLKKHGYTIADYAAGTAYKTGDPKQQTKSIGSILKDKKTEAPQELISGFDNDNRTKEAQISPETHDILLSRVPEHVGECGTNKRWQRSCVQITPSGRPTRYGSGLAAKKLKQSIKLGTHVAYLMKKDETDPEKAEARILLHPYHAYDKDGNIIHSVIMPERKVYTVGDKTKKRSAFHNSLEDYIREKSPMKPGLVYHKPSDKDGVYDDDNQTIRYNTSPESIKQILLGNDVGEYDKRDAIKLTKFNNNTISSILNIPKTDENYYNLGMAHNLIARHQKLSNENFEHLLKLGHGSDLANNKTLSSSQVKRIANYKPEESNTGNSENDKKINERQIAELAVSHAELISNHPDKLGPDEINNILDNNEKDENNMKADGKKVSNSYSSPIYRMALSDTFKDKLTPEHIEKIKKSIHEESPNLTGEKQSEFNFRNYLDINPTDSKGDIDKKLTDAMNLDGSKFSNRKIQEIALQHPNITEQHISKALEGHPDIAYSAMRSKNATPENINKALDHNDNLTQIAAADHPNNNTHTINKALDHENLYVRLNAVKNEKATPTNISKALKDSSLDVANAAASNPNNNENTINQALDHENRYVRLNAVKNKKATESNLNKALNDSDKEVQMRAILHKNASHEFKRNAIKNLKSNELKYLIDNSDGDTEELHKAILDNRNTPSESLNSMISYHRKNQDMLKKIANHPNAGPDTLHRILIHGSESLADKDLQKEILKNKNPDSYTLQRLKFISKDPEIQDLIQSHPNYKG